MVCLFSNVYFAMSRQAISSTPFGEGNYGIHIYFNLKKSDKNCDLTTKTLKLNGFKIVN